MLCIPAEPFRTVLGIGKSICLWSYIFIHFWNISSYDINISYTSFDASNSNDSHSCSYNIYSSHTCCANHSSRIKSYHGSVFFCIFFSYFYTPLSFLFDVQIFDICAPCMQHTVFSLSIQYTIEHAAIIFFIFRVW